MCIDATRIGYIWDPQNVCVFCVGSYKGSPATMCNSQFDPTGYYYNGITQITAIEVPEIGFNSLSASPALPKQPKYATFTARLGCPVNLGGPCTDRANHVCIM